MLRVRRCVTVVLLSASAVLMAQTATRGDESRKQIVESCGAAPVPARDSEPNIFSDQQESWLGQTEADLVESEMHPVRNAALSAHLQAIADRLVATLPATSIHFRVILVDSDQINGFSIAGGHVYISRKLAAVARSDDELAGVIGHEIGHIISHQFAFDTTREMKRLLNVTSAGDATDIRTKYEAMMDAEYHDKHPELHETNQEQAEADRIGLYAMTAAGYQPKAYGEFWNHVFFVEGKTGNRLGNLLGFTKPTQKRLGSISAMIAAIPAGCGSGVQPEEQSFSQWHEAVVANQAGAEAVQTLASQEVQLTPPLRMALDRIRFSPDGKSLLAQDESSIFVLQRDPLALRYRIAAPQALQANFSPDSQSITFSTPGLHIEQWSAVEKKLLAAREMLVRNDCYDTRLSPDGRTLICVQFDTDEWMLKLAMIDTATSAVLWENKSWMRPALGLALNLIASRANSNRAPFFISSYSADGNVLLFAGGEHKVAFDLKQRSVIKTGGGIRDSISGSYAFLGNDRLAGVNRLDPKHSAILSFPEGKVLETVPFYYSDLGTVSHSKSNSHALIYGLKGYAVGIGDFLNGKPIAALKSPAMDEYDGVIAGESLGGEVVLAQMGASGPGSQTDVKLPVSPLPYYPTAALSKNGRYLALSTNSLGGVWDLTDGKEVMMLRGFSDAVWGSDDKLYIDVPKDADGKRHIAEILPNSRAARGLPYQVTDEAHMRYGRLTDWAQDKKKDSWTLSLHDPATDSVLWSTNFPDRYFSYTASYGGRDLIFTFALDTHTAREAVKADATLQAEVKAITNKKTVRWIEVLDGETGKQDGSIVVELPPNYAGADGLNRAGNLLYVAGVDDRTAVYSMSTGKQLRDLIGYVMALDPATGRVFTVNRVGEGAVFDADGQELSHYTLGEPIRFAMFHTAGTKVTVLTADQKVRTMNLAAATQAAEAASATASR